ncbi:MAG TPA: hypothetical protein VKT71_12750 [Candidatus Acidoferrales bacterium]|nr:hypothetical protein [Candidatus Acidoferrales bacterium]
MTSLLPVALASAMLTALIVTVLELGIVAGAVYAPEELIVPVAALPFATPFTCQVTAVFEFPETVALNDCVAPARTLAVAGEIMTVTPDPEGGLPEFPGFELEAGEFFVVPVHPDITAVARIKITGMDRRKVKFFSMCIGMENERAAFPHRLVLGNYARARRLELLYGSTK